jgi:CxxC motif-containing protein (DUF1111 family)
MKQLSPPLLLICIFSVLGLAVIAFAQSAGPATEAPTGFDTQPNGMVDQVTHDGNREVFEEAEGAEEGLGPVYNAEACSSCHQNPVTGAISQVTELRAGHRDSRGNFVDAAGGSLINDRAIHPSIQERVAGTETVRTFRTSLNTLGDGFVEAIDSNTLLAIANNQPRQSGGRIAGQFIQVPVLEAPGTRRGGRFGWKNQHASLVSFSADAYLNEMGITSPMANTENTSMGNSVAAYDAVAEPEDDGEDIEVFAAFMRATKAPPRDTALAGTPDAKAGQQLFSQIGCAICHLASITTSPPGTVINGGTFTVPAALGNKIIHPYSDFLLHNVGTGDGIVQNGGPSTANKLRTAPLWGLRTRNRLMHDGESLTRNDAILRHGGEATFVINSYRNLTNNQKNQLVTFLNSL